jgi:hypothetical protein
MPLTTVDGSLISGTITVSTSASSYANSAYGQANTATTNAATADQRAVTSGSYANSAFSTANTKFNSSGGTISGAVTISSGGLTVTGNVVSTGNVSAQFLIGDGSLLTGMSSGGVTSLNGQTGGITNTSFQAIGSYVLGLGPNPNSAPTYNTDSTYSGGSIRVFGYSSFSLTNPQSLSGTWRALGSLSNASSYAGNQYFGPTLFVRIS